MGNKPVSGIENADNSNLFAVDKNDKCFKSKDFKQKCKEISKLAFRKKYGRYAPSIKELYVTMYYYTQILEYSTTQIASHYGVSVRSIELVLEELGLNRNRFEAQKIAVKHRDYSQIRATKKANRLNSLSADLFGSNPENYIRLFLNELLTIHVPNGVTSIVGLPSQNIVRNNEIDIPVVLILGNQTIYRFAIEINGTYWHNDKDAHDIAKANKCYGSGWNYVSIDIKRSYSVNECKEKVINTVDYILNYYEEHERRKENIS